MYLTAPGLRRAISGHGPRQGLLQPRQVCISRHLGYAGRSLDMGHAKAYYNPARYVSHGTWATPGDLWTWATPRPTTTPPGMYLTAPGLCLAISGHGPRQGLLQPRQVCISRHLGYAWRSLDIGHAKAYYNPARYVSHGTWAMPGDLWTWATPRPTTTPPGMYLTAPGLRRAISGHGPRQVLLQPRQVCISRHLGYAGRSLDMGHAKAYYNPARYVSHGTWATPGDLWTWATPRPTTTPPGMYLTAPGLRRAISGHGPRQGLLQPRQVCISRHLGYAWRSLDMGHAKAYYNPARYVSHGTWAMPGDLWTLATPRPTTTPPGMYLTAPGLRRAISGHGPRQGLL